MPSPKKVSFFGFDELVRVPSDYLDAAPPVAKETPKGANEGTLVTGIALERRGSRRHGLLGRLEYIARRCRSSRPWSISGLSDCSRPVAFRPGRPASRRGSFRRIHLRAQMRLAISGCENLAPEATRP